MVGARVEAFLDANDYALILHSWMRVPLADVRSAFAAMRADGFMPGLRARLAPADAAAGLIGTMLLAVDGGRGWRERAAAACGMSLEGDREKDPLDGQSREAFCRLVGETLGFRSVNGYKNLVESLGQALLRYRANVGAIELERVAVRFGGTEPYGTIEARDVSGSSHVFRFAPFGQAAERGGLQREVWAGKEVIAGVAFVLSADDARRAG